MNTYLVFGHDNKLLCDIKADAMIIGKCDYCHYDICSVFYCFTVNSGKGLNIYVPADLVHHMIMIDTLGHTHNDLAIPFPEVFK